MKKEYKPLDFYQVEERTFYELPFVEDGLFAGFPSPAEDHNMEAIDLTKELIRHPNTTFIARVVGDSMIDALCTYQSLYHHGSPAPRVCRRPSH